VTGNLLPDCRAKVPTGTVFRPDGAWVPIYCANCGTEGGLCPAENMTFFFYLCNACAETHGQIAGTMLMPDEVFFETVRQEQLEKYGRYLTQQELAVVVETDQSPLATLLKSGL
jgi:hypothetical protein